MKLEQYIREQALRLGFGAVGFAAAGPSKSFASFQEWIGRGYGAEMHYLAHHAALRADPRHLMPRAKSIIVVAARYPSEKNNYPISNYARGLDYHKVIRTKLNRLATAIEEQYGNPIISRACVDTAPLLEREWAVRAGIGWIGRQGSIVNPALGTCLFLGELLVNIELEASAPLPNLCGDCRLCLEACPTKAVLNNNQIDARRCISYLTMEHKKDFTPEAASLLDSSVFGCDCCTVACPWNLKAKASVMKEFRSLPMPAFEEYAALDQKGFKKYFADTPLEHIGFEQFKRNVQAVMINKKSESSSQ
jgi:epoxyqueuosine reductase